jgi:hypothetical protein
MLSYTDNDQTTRGHRTPVVLKSYPVSPLTETAHMDAVLHDLYTAKAVIEAQVCIAALLTGWR